MATDVRILYSDVADWKEIVIGRLERCTINKPILLNNWPVKCHGISRNFECYVKIWNFTFCPKVQQDRTIDPFNVTEFHETLSVICKYEIFYSVRKQETQYYDTRVMVSQITGNWTASPRAYFDNKENI